ncbi:interferon-induced protein 44-like isoform X2 [Periophthalmus magnuspinnatus]|uniref:interferon-induced protein 44-like isoform X2 n=1 Tax=Periophthalmus magnuspinnatus TaxID=409849 RepID=UPI00145A131C|nr:interferon-induced protein 44-like isoform X2 [Periophthalmus magnuspinnatus]
MSFTFGAGSSNCVSIPSTTSSTSSTSTTSTSLFNLGMSDSSTEKETKETKKTQEFKQNSFLSKLQTPWRRVEWTEEERSALVQRLSSYAPCCPDVGRARVLLLGPVGSGKSSFISSVDSVFEGRVTNRAMVGQGQSSFTQKLQCFPLCPSKRTCALELWDSMGFGDCSGPNLQQLLSVVKGHAPEGYEFRAEQALSSDTEGYIKRPGLREQMHCVAFVLDASKVLTSSYSKGTGVFLRQLRRHVSDLGVHQVVLLTHVDQICNKTQKDTSEVYTSSVIRQMMYKAAELVGMSPSSVVPVRNYWCELELDLSSDILLLRALELLLQYTDLYYREQQRATSKHDL